MVERMARVHFKSGLRTDDEAIVCDVYSFWRQNSLLGFENERKISILFAFHGIDSLAESSVIDSFFPLRICSISANSCFTNKDLLVSKTTTRS